MLRRQANYACTSAVSPTQATSFAKQNHTKRIDPALSKQNRPQKMFIQKPTNAAAFRMSVCEVRKCITIDTGNSGVQLKARRTSHPSADVSMGTCSTALNVDLASILPGKRKAVRGKTDTRVSAGVTLRNTFIAVLGQ